MSSCQAWWSRSNNCHFLSCPNSRQFWMNPALFKCKVNDGTFNVFDGHWWFTDSQHTRTFTWCRAYPASEFCTRHKKQNGWKFWTSEYTQKNIIYKLICFRKVPYCGIFITWEVVCLQQLVQSLFPTVVEHKIIPLWNDVAKRASMRALTKRNTTLHASCSLHTQPLANMSKIIDFYPVFETLLCRTIHPCLSLVLNKAPAERCNKSPFTDVINTHVKTPTKYNHRYPHSRGVKRPSDSVILLL